MRAPPSEIARDLTERDENSASPHDRQREGFALLLVIWILALLAVVAAGVAANSQSESQLAHNRLERVEARSIADAGVALAVAGLMVPDITQRWHADGGARTIPYGGGTVTVTVQDEGGKIDLNQAPPELIGSLLDTLDPATKEIREALVNAIMQQRQTAAAATPNAGGVALSFRRRQRVSLLNAAFADVSELKQMPGVTPAIYAMLLPLFTVYTGSPTINPLTAPRDVLIALPGVSAPTIDLYMNAREAQQSGQASGELPSLGAEATRYIAINDLSTVTIDAAGKTTNGPTFRREAVVSFDSTATLPFRYLAWREGTDATDMTVAEAEH